MTSTARNTNDPRDPMWRLDHDGGRHLKFAAGAEFSKKLKTLLAQKDISASDLARELFGTTTIKGGYSAAKHRDRVSKWLAGKTLPDPVTLEKVCKFLKVDPTTLAPTVVAHAIGADHPEFHITQVPGRRDKVHLTINSVLDLTVALRIVELMGASAGRAPTDAEIAAKDKAAHEINAWTAKMDPKMLMALVKALQTSGLEPDSITGKVLLNPDSLAMAAPCTQ